MDMQACLALIMRCPDDPNSVVQRLGCSHALAKPIAKPRDRTSGRTWFRVQPLVPQCGVR